MPLDSPNVLTRVIQSATPTATARPGSNLESLKLNSSVAPNMMKIKLGALASLISQAVLQAVYAASIALGELGVYETCSLGVSVYHINGQPQAMSL